jgi:hypothetical protein
MSDERRFTHLVCGSIHVRRARSDDGAIGELAGAQQGVAGRRQLLELGVGERAIDHRLRLGRLLRLFPGVYAVGHDALTEAALALAAVLATAPGSVASHWTAARLHGLLDRPRPIIHISASRSRRRRPGVLIHRAVLPALDLTVCEGVPATTAARVLLDLSGSTGERRLRTMAKRAEFKGLIDAAALVEILRRHPRRRGRGNLARLIGGYALAAGPTMSPIEDDFAEFCGGREIPAPETNVPMRLGLRTVTFDCVWREARLVVELDGRTAHERRLAFEDDRARDRAAIAAGWRPIRITSAQIEGTPDVLELDLRAALGIDERGFAHP